ncbi:VOC family protein [Martelella soudanensis]|uniref:VOC family protein n=1 Tax=unclassified Martelella TaxID=2629616 RepID=UPI0015E03AC6|nr:MULTISPECIES: VOC family protein [unclassified Martelella]
MITENSARIRLGRIAPTLGVNDIETSYRLYNALFGFEKIFANGDPVGFMILKKDDAELHLTLQKGHVAAHFNVAHLLVSDADAAYKLCQKHDLRIIKRIQDKDYGLRAFVFADRDGNRIDVGEANGRRDAET